MSDKRNHPHRSNRFWLRRPRQRFGISDFLIGGLICVGFPGLLTAMVPVSWLDFHRVDQRVDVRTRTCVFFFVPYLTQELVDVRQVSTEFKQGQTQRRRRDGHQTQEESKGTVILHGPKVGDEEGKSISVSVSPASYKQVEAKVQAFLADPQQSSLTLFTVANWKFGIIFAVPLCLLTVLFVVGWTLWLLDGLTRPLLGLFRSEVKETSEEAEGTDGV